MLRAGGPGPGTTFLAPLPPGSWLAANSIHLFPSQINDLTRSPPIPLIPLALPDCAKNGYASEPFCNWTGGQNAVVIGFLAFFNRTAKLVAVHFEIVRSAHFIAFCPDVRF